MKCYMNNKPYPWTCGSCAKKSVYPVKTDYKMEYFEGKLYDFIIPDFIIPTCNNCGDQWFSLEQSDLIEAFVKNVNNNSHIH